MSNKAIIINKTQQNHNDTVKTNTAIKCTIIWQGYKMYNLAVL